MTSIKKKILRPHFSFLKKLLDSISLSFHTNIILLKDGRHFLTILNQLIPNILIFRDKNEISTSTKLLYNLIKIVTRKYPNIHQIHTLYVEKKTGYVYIDNRRPLFEADNRFLKYLRKRNNWFIKSAMDFWDGLFSHLKLDIETLNEMKQIVKRRQMESN